jgi:hypothetical protein
MTDITNIEINGVKYLVAAYSQPGDNSGVVYSTNEGKSWTKVPVSRYKAYAYDTSAHNLYCMNGALYFVTSTAYTDSQHHVEIYKSQDLLTWTEITNLSKYCTDGARGDVLYSDSILYFLFYGENSDGYRQIQPYFIKDDKYGGRAADFRYGYNDTGAHIQILTSNMFSNKTDTAVIAVGGGGGVSAYNSWNIYYGNTTLTKAKITMEPFLEAYGTVAYSAGCYADGRWILCLCRNKKLYCYYSTNKVSWTLAQTIDLTDIMGNSYYSKVSIQYINGIVYLTVLLKNRVFISKDRGITWEQKSTLEVTSGRQLYRSSFCSAEEGEIL